MITLKYIRDNFKELTVYGDDNISFDNVSTYESANNSSIIWFGKKIDNQLEKIKKTKASVIVCCTSTDTDISDTYKNKGIIISHNPRLDFMRIINLLKKDIPYLGVDSTVKLFGVNEISESAIIAPGCVIINCKISENVIIHSNCTISNTIIKSNVIINSGTQIGTDGFGYEKDSSGQLIKFSHFGGVVIENNVEIGSNTCIDRGTINDTIIGQGSKIDNLVHIAHNVKIGRNCVVIAHAMIGGSAEIEDGAWISPSAVIRDGIKIGKNALVGMGSVVTKNIPDNEVWMGNPAKFFKKNNE